MYRVARPETRSTRLRILGIAVAVSVTAASDRVPGSETAGTPITERREALRDAVATQDPERIADAIDRLREADPSHPDAFIQAVLLFRRDDDALLRARLRTMGGPDHPGTRLGEGIADYFRARLESATRHLEACREDYRRIGHAAGEAACAFNLGNVLGDSGDPDRGIAYLTIARDAFARLGDTPNVVQARARIGRMEARRGNLEAALEQFDAAIAEIPEDEPESESSVRHLRGLILLQAGRYAAAIDDLERALALWRNERNVATQIATRIRLAEARLGVGHVDEALEVLVDAIATARDAALEDELVLALRARADLHLSRDRFADAYADLSEAAAADPGNREVRVRILHRLGIACLGLRRLEEATRYLSAAAADATAAGLDELFAHASEDLARALLARHRLDGAMLAQARAVDRFDTLARPEDAARGESTLGVIAYTLGDLATSTRHFEAALERAERLDDDDLVRVARINLGIVRHDAGDPAGALTLLDRVWPRRPVLPDTRDWIARLNTVAPLVATGRVEEAARRLDAFDAAPEEHRTVTGIAHAATLRGVLAMTAGTEEALANAIGRFRWAVDYAEDFRLHDLEHEARLGLSEALRRTGDDASALAELERAIRRLERRRERIGTPEIRARFFGSHLDVYDRALETAARIGGPTVAEDTLSIVLRAEDRGGLDRLAERDAGGGAERRRAAVAVDLSEAIAHLRTEGSTPERLERVERLERELELLEIESSAGSSGTSRARSLAPRLEPATARELLSRDEQLLVYWFSERRGWLWSVTPKTTELLELSGSDAVSELAYRAVDEIGRATLRLGSSTRPEPHTAALSKALLPSGLRLSGTRLRVVADGPVRTVPIAMLPFRGERIVRDHEVVVVPSVSDLASRRARPSPRRDARVGRFAALGAPTLPFDSRLAPLEDAKRGLAKMTGLFDDRATTLAVGGSFTRGVLPDLALDRYRYIHFATHGWIESADARRSGLIVTPDRFGNLLHVAEIANLRLDADLVTVASCRSATGIAPRGAGLAGLARAFLEAGANSVLVTAWNVDDRTTAEFMLRFYARVAGGSSPAAALRATQLEFATSDRPTWRRPYAWAPFVLIGNPDVAESVEPESAGAD